MVANWLKELNDEIINQYKEFGKSALGGNINFIGRDFSTLKQNKISIIGIEPVSAAKIRNQLYSLEFAFPGLQIADLGNLRKPEPAMMYPLVRELVAGNILPIFIGGSDLLGAAQWIGYQDLKALVNLVIVDEKFRAGQEPQHDKTWNSTLFPRNPMLFHLGLIGCQSHFISPTILEEIDKNAYELLRLGKAKASIESTEPLIRDADALILHLSALKSADAPGVTAPSPSGFTSEEACQICRYAGISDKLNSFGVYGYDPDRDQGNLTAGTIAQLVWYFLEGFYNRKGDYPVSTDGLMEYIVDYPGFNFQLTFWKSKKSGRWWMQAPAEPKKKQVRHRLIPCSFSDYQLACKDELPDRLLKAISRFK